MLALRYLLDIVLTGQPYLEGLELAEAEARAALELDRESAIAHPALAWVLSWDAAQAALDEADLAISLNPNDPQGHLIRGRILVLSGRPVEVRNSGHRFAA